MNAENFSVEALVGMAHSPVRNYAIPGLTSWLIGAPSPKGTVRLFVSEREHEEPITPHSHRFDFQCWVLDGSVTNRLWLPTYQTDRHGDKYQASTLHYDGDMGKYRVEPGEINCWRSSDKQYHEGECYSMTAKEVHSIFFSRGARVLFFEGPTIADTSTIIQPVSGGEVIPTFEVKPWMFQRGAA
jgi:hypothetical protein